MRALLFFSTLLILMSCTPRPPVPPVGPTDADAGTDTGTGIDAGDDGPDSRRRAPTCADACARLTVLHCAGGATTPGGATCLDVCRNVQESGIVAWNLSCLSNAKSCATAESCPNVVR